MKRLLAPCLTTLLLAASAMHAEEFVPPMLGAALSATYEPYRGGDDKPNLLPWARFESEHMFLRGTSLGVKIINGDGVELSALGEFRGDGFNASNNPYLKGMQDRDPAFEGGVQITYRPDRFGVRLTALTDVTSTHDGHELRAGVLFRDRVWGVWMVQASADLVYQSANLVDYYFGVPVKESLLGLRPSYQANAELNYRLGIVAMRMTQSSPWVFTLGVHVTLYGNEIQNSPIVGDNKAVAVFAGVGYRLGN